MEEFTLRTVALSTSALAILVLVGMATRRHVPFLRRLFVPNAVTAGFLALLLGPEVLGTLTGDDGRFSAGLFGGEVVAVWAALPGMLINVVFASILLGKSLPRPAALWRAAAPQALFGATLSFGQYAFGLLLTVFVLVPVFDMSELSGGLLEISFTGGLALRPACRTRSPTSASRRGQTSPWASRPSGSSAGSCSAPS